MGKLKSLVIGLAVIAMSGAIFAAPDLAHAKQVKIRVQSVIPAKADEVVMLKDYAANVSALTNGEVQIEVPPAGAVVGVKETLEAVDKGLVEGGFAWTHYWSGYHPAAMLFGSPTAGSGLGMDNIAWISWFMYGGGKQHDAIHGLASAGTRRNSPISADRLVVAELYIWPINGAPNPIWGAL